MWLKKEGATIEDYQKLCSLITDEIDIPINFEGYYKWIMFLPSRLHPQVSVLNRYLGVIDNGKIKVRGLEVRKRDTPGFVYNAQTDMINILEKLTTPRNFTGKFQKQSKSCRCIVSVYLMARYPLST